MLHIEDTKLHADASAQSAAFPPIESRGPLNPPLLFRLGMPHLGGDGLSRGWLLREACHAHWREITAHLNGMPTCFLDKAGARVLPSVVACTVNGDAAQFREDDVCEAFLSEFPSAENGWRSQLELHNDRAKSIRAEIITSFARRSGPSNRDLERADLGPEFQAERTHPDMRRTSVIRQLGQSMRIQAEADQDPPHLTVQIDPSRHINGVGLVYFAAIHDIFESAEHNAIPDLIRAWPLRDRRVHYFGNLDAGDHLDLTSRASAQSLAQSGSVVVQSHAKRASDGHVVATAESVYAA